MTSLVCHLNQSAVSAFYQAFPLSYFSVFDQINKEGAMLNFLFCFRQILPLDLMVRGGLGIMP
tara:strand:+ start:16 stop:204 length:189 start_codon:yes stop_codon:yes gene_type:complete